MNTDQVVSFLKKHRIKADEIFDAEGLQRSDYQSEMKKRNKLFALNAGPCEQGHRIRNRSGHCVVCNTANIHHYRLWHRFSHVYIAGSLQIKALKIGTSDDPLDRMRRLNGESYGGTKDWVVLVSVKIDEAGRREKELQTALKRYFKEGSYLKNKSIKSTYELVNCGISTVEPALEKVLLAEEIKEIKTVSRQLLSKYNFE